MTTSTAPAPAEYDLTLDQTRDHGVVFPPENNAHFMQDGFYFDAHGKLTKEMLDADALARLKRMKAMKNAQAAARKTLEATLAKEGFDPKDFAHEETLEKIAQKVAPGGVNLVAWATGQAKYPWFTVANEAQKQLDFIPSSAANLIEFMVTNGMVDEGMVKPVAPSK